MNTVQDLFDISEEEFLSLVEEAKYHHYGKLPIIDVNGEEWAIALNEEEANQAAGEYIEQTAWAFSADYLQDITGIPYEMFEAVQDKCEGANDAILACIEATCGIESFRDHAISDNGRGILSGYNGEEEEFQLSDKEDICYAYRLN